MARVTANGISVHVEVEGSGAPVLCIHGTGSSALAWQAAVPALARRARVISYDRRGCHRSERPTPFATSVAEQADDAAALLESLDAEPAVLVGRSYGGGIALDLAMRHPESVRALVLLEPALAPREAAAREWTDEVERLVRSASEEDPSTVAEVFLTAVLGEGAWEQFPHTLREVFTGNGPAILAELDDGDLDVADAQLAAIACPTLVVAAEDSPRAFAEAAERIVSSVPGAQLERVPGGHLVDPADPVVLEWLDQLLAS